ncbi:hypothetical protein [Pararhodospirillum photometricum]|uniref:Uncharacterized protein n=1 Tax=Pararhodospirillum photometricum DSM 122 TaxID=1150469 RepID=H6SR79_PARPM|nr:hypothetical protein [Pararhodospirillum photometricum]CCG09801.1 unnamed protein product [Pararhodospirillum photometricum DSM 122]
MPWLSGLPLYNVDARDRLRSKEAFQVELGPIIQGNTQGTLGNWSARTWVLNEKVARCEDVRWTKLSRPLIVELPPASQMDDGRVRLSVYPGAVSTMDRQINDKILLTRVTATLKDVSVTNGTGHWMRAWASGGGAERESPPGKIDLSFLGSFADLLETAERFKASDAVRADRTVVDLAFTSQLSR